MPIKPENVDRYPPDWPQIRARIQTRAKNCCEFCGVKNWSLGGRDRDGKFFKAMPKGETGLQLEYPKLGEHGWCGETGPEFFLRIIRIVCTTAHLDHTPENCSDENLRFLCQRCHLAYDRQHHLQSAAAGRREGKAVGDLFEENVA